MHLEAHPSKKEPVTSRIVAIDALRGLALFGVLAVNVVTEFRVSIFEQFVLSEQPKSFVDMVVNTFVSTALESKAITIFSLLFGVGLAMQFQRLSSTKQPYYWLFRRLAVLLLLGAMHLVFIWNGDILTEYALAGLLVLPFLGMPTRLLAGGAIVLFAAYAIVPFLPTPFPFPSEDALRSHITAANMVFPRSGFVNIWRFSIGELPFLLPLLSWILPRTIALFFLGAVLWRTDSLGRALDPHTNIGALALAVLSAGAAMTFVSVAFPAQLGIIGPPASQLAPVILALGYVAGFLAVWRIPSGAKLLSTFAPVGRMAFTNYITQSLVCTFLFFGYGLGLYGRIGTASALGIAVAIYLAQLLLSRWWLHRYHFGPLEWLWRALMYGSAPAAFKRVIASGEQWA